MLRKAPLVSVFVFYGVVALANPQLRVGPVEGLTDDWRVLRGGVHLPVGTSVQLEFVWGRGLADINIDGRVDLSDYATLAVCYGLPGGSRLAACSLADHSASDLDGDGDVDADDSSLFHAAYETSSPFEIRSITWGGAQEVTRDGMASVAELDLSKPGSHTVRVEASLFDPASHRVVTVTRESTINVLELRPQDLDGTSWAQWDSQPRNLASGPRDLVMDMVVNAWTESGDSLAWVMPGDLVHFDVGVAVDPDGGHPLGNYGLATVVYNVLADSLNPALYQLNPMNNAESGWWQSQPTGDPAGLHDVSSFLYYDSGTAAFPGYDGGWGFTNSGLPTGGNTTSSIGDITGAGALTPLTWTADVNPTYPGLQPEARQFVGHGAYTFPANDPCAGGLQGGFGQDLSNCADITEGDGTWLFQRGVIDTSGWNSGTYSFDVIGTNSAVFSPTLDYSQDQGFGFRLAILGPDIGSTSFGFTVAEIVDCNGNDVPDDQDIAGGTSQDCQPNGIPDECETDCNTNGVPDDCDIAQGTSADCDSDGVPDECQPQDDCQPNGSIDFCDIALGTSEDCNANDVPDECDIVAGTSEDCQPDGVPDECEPDADGDLVPDDCDGCPNDPNKTEPGICGCGVPDIDSDGDNVTDCMDGCPYDPGKTDPGVCGCGTPDTDSDGDLTPDCIDGCPDDPDKTEPGVCGCGIPDVDSDGDQVLDCLEFVPGDLDGDGDVDLDDLYILLARLGEPASGPDDPCDLDGDGWITALDARILVTLCTRPGCATEDPANPPACTCGDLDNDGLVGLNDFATLASCFGLTAPSPSCSAVQLFCSDLNLDGLVNLPDFATFALVYGNPPSGSPPNCAP